jgi:hypothetical protein
MTTEAQTVESGKVELEGSAKTESSKEPAAKSAPKAAAAEKAEPAKAAKVVEDGAAKTGPARHTVKDDEEEIPETAELLELSAKALNSRLARHTKKQLRENFGTDDIVEIKAKISRLQELEDKEEERRRADLSEKEKLEEDLKKERGRAETAERKHQEAIEQRMVDQEDSRIKDIAGEYIKAKHYKHVSRDLAEFLLGEYSEKELANVKDTTIRKWFKDYLEENPEFAKADAAAAPVAKVPLDNGANVKRPDSAPTSGQASSKTARPGQPNSYTKQELASQGWRW